MSGKRRLKGAVGEHRVWRWANTLLPRSHYRHFHDLRVVTRHQVPRSTTRSFPARVFSWWRRRTSTDGYTERRATTAGRRRSRTESGICSGIRFDRTTGMPACWRMYARRAESIASRSTPSWSSSAARNLRLLCRATCVSAATTRVTSALSAHRSFLQARSVRFKVRSRRRVSDVARLQRIRVARPSRMWRSRKPHEEGDARRQRNQKRKSDRKEQGWSFRVIRTGSPGALDNPPRRRVVPRTPRSSAPLSTSRGGSTSTSPTRPCRCSVQPCSGRSSTTSGTGRHLFASVRLTE